MRVDTIKATATYSAALIILIGGFLTLYLTRLDPPDARGPMQLLIGGFMGGAMTFLFSAEAASRATHAATSATAAGVASAPTVTTSAGPPATTTVTPAAPVAPTFAETDGLVVSNEPVE